MENPGKVEKWFWDKVNVAQEHECWNWKGRLTDSGYGASRTLYDLGFSQKAHRFAFQVSSGVNPKDLVVMHTCDNRACCNPSHLRLGTQLDNMRDRQAKGKYPKGEDHGSSKLTNLQRTEIYNAPGTHREIAKKYGLRSHYVVGLIKRGPPR